jgi:hypothetical protein
MQDAMRRKAEWGRLLSDASATRLKSKPVAEENAVMKRLLAIAAVALLCGACAQGGSAPPAAGSGSITMYGTIDEGISYHK